MDLLDTKPDSGFTFNRVPTPLAPENRPIWRISLIALILFQLSRGHKASSQKILALSSIISSKHKRAIFNSVLSKDQSSSKLNIRFDPSVNRAIDFGIAEGILCLDRPKNVCLTEKGIAFAEKLIATEDVFSLEREFMGKFSKNALNERVVNELITG